MDGELHRHAAGVADAVAHALGDADSEDLRLALRSNCFGPADRSSGQILVTIEWSWTRTDPLTEDADAIELQWSQGDPIVPQDGLVDAPPGVSVVPWPYDDDQGQQAALALLLQDSPDGPAIRFTLTPEAARAGGRIVIPFDPSSTGFADMTFGARYAHGAEWRIAAGTPCSLPLPPTSP